MTESRPTSPTFNSFYFLAKPADALKFVRFRCDLVLDLIERVNLPAAVRLELGTNWRYVDHLTDHLVGRWRRNAVRGQETDADTLHIHYVMLPKLLSEHIGSTQRTILRYNPETHVQVAWRRMWANPTMIFPVLKG